MLFRDSYHQLKRKRSRSKMVSQERSGSCRPSCSISNLSAYNELLLLIACLVPLLVGPCVLPALIAVLSIIHAVEEVFQIWIHKGAHFKSKENRLDFAVCALTGILYALVCTRYVLGAALRISYRVSIESRDLEPFHSIGQYRVSNPQYRVLSILKNCDFFAEKVVF